MTHGGFKLVDRAGVGGGGPRWAGRGVARVRCSASCESERVRHIAEPLPGSSRTSTTSTGCTRRSSSSACCSAARAGLLALWDKYVIDGVVNGVAKGARWGAEQVRLAQAGQAQLYASAMLIGVVGAIAGF